MNNEILVKVNGKNILNYLKWLLKNKITIIHLNKIKYNELIIRINDEDYDKLFKYSMTYKITKIKKYGKSRLYEIAKKNRINILCLTLSIVFLYLLSHIIFSIDVMHNDNNITKLVTNELAQYGIRKYNFKKSYAELSAIKEKILNKNKDKFEWLEIEENGTKYIVRLVERKQESKQLEYPFQSIVSSKDATIITIRAYSGEKVKQENEYVKKGDVIISGILTKTDNTKMYIKANGVVSAETWYKVIIEYPLYYQEERITGKSKNVFSICIFNYELPLFPYKKYKQFRKYTHTIIENNILPIKIVKEKLYEASIKEDIYTNEEALEKAIVAAKEKIQRQNNQIIKIKNVEVLTKENLNSKIKVELFISAIENITKIVELKPGENEEKVEN